MQKKCVPYGSDVSSGKFKCVDCGHTITMRSKTSIPPCPWHALKSHPKKCWEVISGQGDSLEDPYPK